MSAWGEPERFPGLPAHLTYREYPNTRPVLCSCGKYGRHDVYCHDELVKVGLCWEEAYRVAESLR